MKSNNIKRTLGLLMVLLTLVLFRLVMPHPGAEQSLSQMPKTADPQTLYHIAWEVTGQTFFEQDRLGDWKSWEHKYDGKLKTPEDADKAINEMLDTLGDRYTRFLSPKMEDSEQEQARGSFVGIGIGFGASLKDGKPVMAEDGKILPELGADGLPLAKFVLEGGPADTAGVKAGDELLSVTVAIPGGTQTIPLKGLSMEGMVDVIRGPQGTPLMVTVMRGGHPLSLLLTREAVMVKTVHYKVLDGNIGYIKIDDFANSQMANQLADALDHLKACRGLIVDVRDNPGGLVPNAIWGAAMFLDHGYIVHMKQRQGGHLVEVEYGLANNQLVIAALDDEGNQEMDKSKRLFPQLAKQPVVILANEHSASAAEMFTGALQDNGRAVVVGVKTYGKGIGQSVIPMPNGTAIHVTSLRYYTPNGHWVGDGTGEGVFAVGIYPDVPVADDKSGNDNQLKAGQQRLESLIANGR